MLILILVQDHNCANCAKYLDFQFNLNLNSCHGHDAEEVGIENYDYEQIDEAVNLDR